MCILIDLNNNFHEDDPDTIILIKLLVWHSKFKKHKALIKTISEVSIPKDSRMFGYQRMRKKKGTSFYWVMLLVCIQYRSIELFCHLI